MKLMQHNNFLMEKRGGGGADPGYAYNGQDIGLDLGYRLTKNK